MEQKEIINFLNYPDTALVEHAVGRANLKSVEWEAIHLRELESETIESAAERLDVSPATVKNRYRSGMTKLNTCWSGLPWVSSIVKQ